MHSIDICRAIENAGEKSSRVAGWAGRKFKGGLAGNSRVGVAGNSRVGVAGNDAARKGGVIMSDLTVRVQLTVAGDYISQLAVDKNLKHRLKPVKTMRSL